MELLFHMYIGTTRHIPTQNIWMTCNVNIGTARCCNRDSIYGVHTNIGTARGNNRHVSSKQMLHIDISPTCSDNRERTAFTAHLAIGTAGGCNREPLYRTAFPLEITAARNHQPFIVQCGNVQFIHLKTAL